MMIHRRHEKIAEFLGLLETQASLMPGCLMMTDEWHKKDIFLMTRYMHTVFLTVTSYLKC
jgi:hypothetical protein